MKLRLFILSIIYLISLNIYSQDFIWDSKKQSEIKSYEVVPVITDTKSETDTSKSAIDKDSINHKSHLLTFFREDSLKVTRLLDSLKSIGKLSSLNLDSLKAKLSNSADISIITSEVDKLENEFNETVENAEGIYNENKALAEDQIDKVKNFVSIENSKSKVKTEYNKQQNKIKSLLYVKDLNNIDDLNSKIESLENFDVNYLNSFSESNRPEVPTIDIYGLSTENIGTDVLDNISTTALESKYDSLVSSIDLSGDNLFGQTSFSNLTDKVDLEQETRKRLRETIGDTLADKLDYGYDIYGRVNKGDNINTIIDEELSKKIGSTDSLMLKIGLNKQSSNKIDRWLADSKKKMLNDGEFSEDQMPEELKNLDVLGVARLAFELSGDSVVTDEYIKKYDKLREQLDMLGILEKDSKISDMLTDQAESDMRQMGEDKLMEKPQGRVIEGGGLDGENFSKIEDNIGDLYDIDKKDLAAGAEEYILEKKKFPYIDNSFFEGTISISDIYEGGVISLSPVFGFKVFDVAKIGAGLNFQYSLKEETKHQAYLGLKGQLSTEFWQDRLFLQVESNSFINEFSYKTTEEEIKEKYSHFFLLGGGVKINIPMLMSTARAGIYYNTDPKMGIPTYDQQWIFRIGISILGFKVK